MSRKILVCGGAGYIGSHMCEVLARHGHDVVTLDNLENGRRENVRYGSLATVDLRDASGVDALLSEHRFDAVMQFAGKIVVSESVRDPSRYYGHNVAGMLNLLEAVRKHGAPPVVFSSTAAVYGDPRYTPIDEAHPCDPVNPYGRTKLIAERMLADFGSAHGLRSVSLRYFNAAGASESGAIGESHEPETHLIPNVLRAARNGTAVDVFGDDYPTPDGSCVRDFVHVLDLCSVHVSALEYLWGGGDTVAVNVGSGQGHSVLEVIAEAERVCGRAIARQIARRRDGDPPVLVANAEKARTLLDWQATQSALPSIIESAWRWEQRSN